MAQVNIRIDDDLKASADVLFDELGLNMSTAVNLFVRQTVRLGGIPFPITTGGDPFYSEAHQRYLRRTIAELESGKATLVAKTEDELRAMADG